MKLGSLFAILFTGTISLVSVPAYAINITHTDCYQQPDNVLRYTCIVETDTQGFTRIEFCEGGVLCQADRFSEVKQGVFRTSGCSGSPGTPPPSTCYRSIIKLWNLKPSTGYHWEAHAWNQVNQDFQGKVGLPIFMTDDLSDPNQDGSSVDDLFSIQLDIDNLGGVQGVDFHVENVLFNFSCKNNPADHDSDYLIIADFDGNIVWYEDTRNVTGASESIVNALSVTPDRDLLAILDHEWLAEYRLDG